ncbi:MAG: Phosphocarrier protein HPr [Chlamydiales bacterium]|nr:Phosphocarrier protein HPr [Chlamydiales bacterium]MCH9619942.1 Phosphocarrier protein HPr [Chlamydiales bacterium]MCH9622631.1 Phosphocarrier protein HPr [Chlamydiales bacterium]
MDEIVKKMRVKNELGLHTRPATTIVKLLQDSKSEVLFTYRKETVSAKSILSILMLAVQKNGLLTITIKGMDAKETMSRLEKAFDERFGEQSR